MGRLIKIHEIDEFSEIKNIPDAAINATIISNVRILDEKTELEPFVRQILYDPNETPHGPVEIADILTSLHLRGDKRIAAFVLKGKSFRNVSSKDVTHQFAKLRQIKGLGLMVFGAIGNIQDDAQRDFLQIAIDAKCDYLIIDTHDWARLFIAYDKICPKDGTPFTDIGICRHGHVLDEGLTLEMEVRERIRYTIVQQRDVSHNGAKRYSAVIVLDKHYPKDVVRTIIQQATENLKCSNYYRNERVRARWGKTSAHLIQLFLAYELEDIQDANWICRSYWIDPSLREDMRPSKTDYNEIYEGIQISWNDDYKLCKSFFETHHGTKEEVLETNQSILYEMLKLAKRSIELFENYKNRQISESDFISKMHEIEPRVSELYRHSGNIPIPPEDCKDYDQACQNIFATIHDMVLYYSEKGLQTWPTNNRDWLMKNTITRFYEHLDRIKFEESKIH